ncbi:YgiW/YdeI family stress tolerance OB fold protein [Photobacterium alginatilyticum]|uniref:NirD/YgiW/YdeI family stress tolerance protein n=1 Tax=Photobacterium alginatilyticum TaxID=1775171 RepID=A0ABW9YEY4_9GAMM|nr:NirD/YgiW/YdeI family stress tolerance protein [Photobacterium alginatilyticum]
MKKTIIAIATIAVMAPAMALAGDHDKGQSISYSGPVDTVTVAELLEDTGMLTERNAVVEGKLIKQINADTFIFSDGTKEIQVEIDDDIRLPQTIDATTRVRLFGEYEGGNTPEIEVDRLQIL